MKYLICLIILSSFILSSCEKGDPEIAPIEELSALSFSETFMCQPLAYNDHLVALINRNSVTTINSYDEHGNKLWQKQVDQYLIPGLTYSNITYLSLDKSQNGDFILNMFLPVVNQTNRQIFKAISFDLNGNFQWQSVDYIHQPDTIIIALDTIDIKPAFIAAGMVHSKNGSHLVLSSQITNSNDSTYIQISTYSNSGLFVNDKYLKIQGARLINDIFLTSDEQLIMFVSNGSNSAFIMIDLIGNIIFEINPPVILINEYFFYENSQGNILVSASYLDNTANFNGIVFCFDKTGKVLWDNNLQGPQAAIMTSVQEKSDGFIFSGFTSPSTLLTDIDWRTTFTQNKYEAVIQKTALNGEEVWTHDLKIIENTAGAATIGTDNIGLFCGKFQNNIKNVLLLKFDNKGKILN